MQRVGDTYNYLTNEEQDIEQEIKSTDIDSTKEIEELEEDPWSVTCSAR